MTMGWQTQGGEGEQGSGCFGDFGRPNKIEEPNIVRWKVEVEPVDSWLERQFPNTPDNNHGILHTSPFSSTNRAPSPKHSQRYGVASKQME